MWVPDPGRGRRSKWNREAAAFTKLFRWAEVLPLPVDVSRPEDRPADSVSARVSWLTPRGLTRAVASVAEGERSLSGRGPREFHRWPDTPKQRIACALVALVRSLLERQVIHSGVHCRAIGGL